MQDETKAARAGQIDSLSYTFLKLGGSLITEKSRPRTPRLEALARLSQEIAAARSARPDLRLVVGHGSGSFGHIPARRYGTRQGVQTPEGWLGFAEVWKEAAALDHLVLDALQTAGLPAISFPASASLLARDGQVVRWELGPLTSALQAGLLPVIYGDVVFDQALGGTIFSTEDLFAALASHLPPTRLLLAGIEAGVWADFPRRTRLIAEITPANLPEVSAALKGSAAPDVTGGMSSKVTQMLDLAVRLPRLEIVIFSADRPGLLQHVLAGGAAGTVIHR